jgi:predicted nucleic acid-binding protein
MSRVVVDVSLAFKWVIQERDSAVATAKFRSWRRQNVRVLAPSCFACELANALYQRVRSGRLATRQAIHYQRAVLRWVAILDPEPAVAVHALEIAAQLGQRASYDSQYVALAEHLGCELWTADQRFGRVAQAAFPFVHWLGEPVPPTGTGQAGP